MGYRPANDPFNGVEPIADKLIGNAYDTVRTVATNIAVVKHVSANLEMLSNLDAVLDDVTTVATNLALISTVSDTATLAAAAAATSATAAGVSATASAASAVLADTARDEAEALLTASGWVTATQITNVTADQQAITAKLQFLQSGSGAATRSIQAKLRDEVSVNDFTGADNTGVADSTAAIALMAASVGFVRLTAGNYKVTTATLDVPIHFDPGAYITVVAANTYTITAPITSPRQYIFRGSGLVVLSSDSDSGENARMAHVSWFGAFASSTAGADQAPFIQKAITAFGNSRESELEFDFGNYHIFTAMTVTRGCHIKGSGTRRTVFRLNADGFDVFTTTAVACKFSNIQFEVESPLTTRLTGCYIKILHGECEVYDVQCFAAVQGIVIAANNARVSNIVGTYGSDHVAGSSLVHLLSGTGTRISNVMSGTSTSGPEAFVRIGGTGGGAVSGFQVDNIVHTAPGASIHVEAFAGNVVRGVISNIVYNGSAGTAPTYAVKFATSSTFTCSDIVLSDVSVSSYATNGVLFQQDSSGVLEDIALDGVNITGSTGIGVQFTRSAGTLRDIRVSDTCDMTERATPFGYSGTTGNIRISPMATPSAQPAYCYTSSVADDAVLVIDLQKSVFTGVGIVTVGSTNYGMYLVRAASTPAVTAMTTVSANMNATTGVLTGTTGTDGKVTVSAADKFIYVENRLGSSQAVHFTLLTGN